MNECLVSLAEKTVVARNAFLPYQRENKGHYIKIVEGEEGDTAAKAEGGVGLCWLRGDGARRRCSLRRHIGKFMRVNNLLRFDVVSPFYYQLSGVDKILGLI
jgi:hypothetical protein